MKTAHRGDKKRFLIPALGQKHLHGSSLLSGDSWRPKSWPPSLGQGVAGAAPNRRTRSPSPSLGLPGRPEGNTQSGSPALSNFLACTAQARRAWELAPPAEQLTLLTLCTQRHRGRETPESTPQAAED